MAPEANVLKRKQKDCFTSHKWGRREVGKEALSAASLPGLLQQDEGRGEGCSWP